MGTDRLLLNKKKMFGLLDPTRLSAISLFAMTFMGAAGGHKKEWSALRTGSFHMAQIYHLLNAVGLYMSGQHRGKYGTYASYAFMLGHLLFVFPYYYRVFTEKVPIKFMMPAGGMSTMIGFLMSAFT